MKGSTIDVDHDRKHRKEISDQDLPGGRGGRKKNAFAVSAILLNWRARRRKLSSKEREARVGYKGIHKWRNSPRIPIETSRS